MVRPRALVAKSIVMSEAEYLWGDRIQSCGCEQ